MTTPRPKRFSVAGFEVHRSRGSHGRGISTAADLVFLVKNNNKITD